MKRHHRFLCLAAMLLYNISSKRLQNYLDPLTKCQSDLTGGWFQLKTLLHSLFTLFFAVKSLLPAYSFWAMLSQVSVPLDLFSQHSSLPVIIALDKIPLNAQICEKCRDKGWWFWCSQTLHVMMPGKAFLQHSCKSCDNISCSSLSLWSLY